jgi:N-acetylmuramoyl-L-alanine amidase
VALRENASVKYQEDTDWSPERQVEYILASADQRAYVHESNFVAGHIQNQLRRRHSGPDRGVKQAGFYVLMGASGSMPAVLVEAGFLSNPSAERMLGSRDGQTRIAEGVANAIAAYFEERERRGSVRTAGR